MKLSEFCKSANERTTGGNEFAPSFIKKIESLESRNEELIKNCIYLKKNNTYLYDALNDRRQICDNLESENLEMKKQNTELAELLKKSVKIVKQMEIEMEDKEVMRQGDGFVYSVCSKCGSEL